VPLGRIAALRTLAYLFIPLDVLVLTRWVIDHADVPGGLYQPLLVGRLLPLPTPTYGLVMTVCAALLVTSVLAATGRAPRLLGIAVMLLYAEWMVIAMSYGKVDHDRVAFLVLLAVLPTVGRARWGDATRSERAGWAVRVTGIAVVRTYFLAAWAKLRFGGVEWLTSGTLTWAVLRRGTMFSEWTLQVPALLVAMQFVMVAFELATPALLFLRDRALRLAVAVCYGFHVMVFAGVTIAFWPHLVMLLAFLPLEQYRDRLGRRWAARRHPVGAAA